jgi:hypothetical protein
VERLRVLEGKVSQLEAKIGLLIIRADTANQGRPNGQAISDDVLDVVNKLKNDVQGIKMRMGKRE